MTGSIVVALQELRALTSCPCDDVRREIDQHRADCLAEYREEVETLATAIGDVYRKGYADGRGTCHGAAHKTHCPRGHAYTDENTYRSPSGRRYCQTCQRTRHAARKEVGRE